MKNIVTPSVTRQGMTDGQIDKAVGVYRDILRKHRSELGSDVVQQILGQSGYVTEQVLILRRRVEAVSDLIVRHFKIDPRKTLEQMITALGHNEYVDKDVLSTIPIDGPEEGDLYFFPGKRFIPISELAGEYERRGLVPHYLAQLQVNVDDPAFADEHPNGMQWSKNSFASFNRWNGERYVYVDRHDHDWYDSCWFAGFCE